MSKYYAFIRNGELFDIQQDSQSAIEGDINVEVTEEVFNNAKQYGWNYYKWDGLDIVRNSAYDDEQAAKRKEIFEKDFFKIEGQGYYRKSPKGYSSAVESINTAFNMVTVVGGLPAGTLIFYTEPDFYDETQCTEEWLVAHQIRSAAMTAEQFGQFYAQFMTAWNTQEHS